MDPARWERTQALFLQLADLPPPERAERLRAACDDAAMVADVEALFEEDERLGSAPQPDVGLLFGQLAAGEVGALARVSFGPYRLRSLLGEGGMGVVYLAERRDLGSLAAIKVLRDAWLSPARRERFAAEQRTLAQLGHPSIARLLDADSLPDGTPWLAMEYVEGVPLTDYCRAHRTSLEGRLELLRAVCVAVQYAHGQAIYGRSGVRNLLISFASSSAAGVGFVFFKNE
jgi:serine/threonine-protein kinase